MSGSIAGKNRKLLKVLVTMIDNPSRKFTTTIFVKESFNDTDILDILDKKYPKISGQFTATVRNHYR